MNQFNEKLNITHYSQEITLVNSKSQSQIRVFPTLLESTLTISNSSESDFQFRIIDIEGKIYFSDKVHKGVNKYEVEIPSGQYIVVLWDHYNTHSIDSYKITKL